MKSLILSTIFLIAGLVLGTWLYATGRLDPLLAQLPAPVQALLPASGGEGGGAAEGGGSGEPKILYWVAPMDPNFRRDKPGKSPMGMDLVPVYEGQDSGDEDTVTISPAVVQNLGVRTAPVERGTLWRRIDTVGYVDLDETRISHIHLRTSGWIERLLVKSEGDRVKKGQLLFELYSPELVNAQEEYVEARRSGNRGLIRASKERLLALGLSPAQIKTLSKTRKPQRLVRTYAPQDGILQSLKIREGMYVMPATTIMSLVDLSSVWLVAEVFERQADWVKEGQAAEVRLPYLPGRIWEGNVTFVYPELDPKTRTLKARLQFDNPDEALKPNMYADVVIYGGPKRDIVFVPREALIRSGDKDRLVVALGEGRFQSREVLAGIEAGDWIEIVKGVGEGEEVVTSAQFLIDSEASIKGSIIRMEGSDAETAAPAAGGPVMGQGTVNTVTPEENKLNLTHDPIPALGWPAMTMDFMVKPGVIPADLAPGETIHFVLEESPEGMWEIAEIHRMGEALPGAEASGLQGERDASHGARASGPQGGRDALAPGQHGQAKDMGETQ